MTRVPKSVQEATRPPNLCRCQDPTCTTMKEDRLAGIHHRIAVKALFLIRVPLIEPLTPTGRRARDWSEPVSFLVCLTDDGKLTFVEPPARTPSRGTAGYIESVGTMGDHSCLMGKWVPA